MEEHPFKNFSKSFGNDRHPLKEQHALILLSNGKGTIHKQEIQNSLPFFVPSQTFELPV